MAESTNFSVGNGDQKMIMKGGLDTGYFIGTGGEIFKSGISTGISVGYDGKIKENGSDTGYYVGSGGTIMRDGAKRDIDWMFN